MDHIAPMSSSDGVSPRRDSEGHRMFDPLANYVRLMIDERVPSPHDLAPDPSPDPSLGYIRKYQRKTALRHQLTTNYDQIFTPARFARPGTVPDTESQSRSASIDSTSIDTGTLLDTSFHHGGSVVNVDIDKTDSTVRASTVLELTPSKADARSETTTSTPSKGSDVLPSAAQTPATPPEPLAPHNLTCPSSSKVEDISSELATLQARLGNIAELQSFHAEALDHHRRANEHAMEVLSQQMEVRLETERRANLRLQQHIEALEERLQQTEQDVRRQVAIVELDARWADLNNVLQGQKVVDREIHKRLGSLENCMAPVAELAIKTCDRAARLMQRLGRAEGDLTRLGRDVYVAVIVAVVGVFVMWALRK